MKNRLLLFNFSTHEVIVNTICLFTAFFFLSGFPLYYMVAVNIIFIYCNLLILNWSIKNKLYDYDVLIQSKPHFTVFFTIVYTLYAILKIFWYYAILNAPVYILDKMNTETTSFENTLIAIGIVLIPFGVVTIIYYISAVNRKMEKTYPLERQDLVNALKLNENETFFCMDNDKICGFISAGHLYSVGRGWICKDVVFDYHQIIAYLKETGLSFSDLDDGHIEVMKMYNI